MVLFFGGNGHAAVRLEAAREVLQERPGAAELVEVRYPGFEGRPASATFAEFLDELSRDCRAREGDTVGAYATGIGALIALALRARGELDVPLIFQGPVLWGLEDRLFPKTMRIHAARKLLAWSLSRPWFQNRLIHRLFLKSPGADFRTRFFEVYRDCRAFGKLFTWFSPQLLRSLEMQFSQRPDLLDRITVWIGGKDRVVGPAEVSATERALRVHWPSAEFPTWGHYPMIDEPKEWADALCHALDVAKRSRRRSTSSAISGASRAGLQCQYGLAGPGPEARGCLKRWPGWESSTRRDRSPHPEDTGKPRTPVSL